MTPPPALRPLLVGFVIVAGSLLAPATTLAQSISPSPTAAPDRPATADDQIVLSGTVIVPRGTAAGEVVVFHGRAQVAGVVYGDVVVIDGSATIGGLVGGSVIALNGAIRMTADAQVGGDVLGAESVRIEPGATVAGQVRETVGFTLQGPVAALGILLGPVAVAVSTLLLLVLLLGLAPRGSERVAAAARTAPFASATWGIVLALVLPLVALATILTIVGLPLGLAVLLAIALLLLVGYAWAVFVVGRLVVREPRSRWLAMVAGWAIAAAVGLVPFLDVVTWVVGAIFGCGAMLVAIWRARGPGTTGRHRAGYARPAPPAQVTTLDLASPSPSASSGRGAE